MSNKETQKKVYLVTEITQVPEEKLQPTIELVLEKAVGALCFLPKSIHILASSEAKERDVTAKRFFFETMLIGLEQQGVITREQHLEALKLPNEYGWKGRKQD